MSVYLLMKSFACEQYVPRINEAYLRELRRIHLFSLEIEPNGRSVSSLPPASRMLDTLRPVRRLVLLAFD